MILYFTGSGNSKFAADAIARYTDDEIVSINDILKCGKEKRFYSLKPFIIVTPVYAWRLPRIIENLITQSEFEGSDCIYFVATMGGSSGNCCKYCESICNKKGMKYGGFCGIKMPDNYVMAYKIPDNDTIISMLNNSIPHIKQIADTINQNKPLYKTDSTPMPGFMSGFVNSFFTSFVNCIPFKASDACIGCKKCEVVCPVNNIKINNGKPVFGKNCINCYSCIHRCPVQAINIGRLTQNNGRYICPDYSEFVNNNNIKAN